MRLPGADRAVVEVAKIASYCLNPLHPWGRHKARAFSQRLGLTRADVFLVRSLLLTAVSARDNAEPGPVDGFGARYVLDFPIAGPKGSALVRSVWIVRAGDDYPRLVTVYLI
jgi:hypothetical protein